MNLETLLAWSSPREVQTRFGPRRLAKAEPTETFWTLWRAQQTELKAAGIGLGKDQKTGAWQVLWWQKLDSAEVGQRQASAALSRAATSGFEPPCPGGLRFYPFQKAGIEFLRGRPAALLADDMGIGKTIQAIGLINCDETIRRVLVVTKASLKENWKRELKRWLVRPMEIGIATGQYWPSHAQTVIINYDVLSKWFGKLHPAQPWDLVILDESAAIKNREAKRTLAVIGRPARPSKNLEALPPIPARRRLCLSGTPIENRPEELWTTLNYLDPVTWGSFWGYAKRYCGMVSNGYGIDTSGATNLDELQRRLRETIMIRRRKADVLTELPSKTRIVIELDGDFEALAAREAAVMDRYQADLEAAQARIELARAGESDADFKAAVKALASSTVAFTEMARVRHETAVAKVPAMIEAIKADLEETGGKILCFGHHHDVLEPLHAAFPGSVLITGQTPPELRQGICDRFQTDPACRVFFGSIRACGEGLTLTAASLVVFAEEDWVPGKVSQAEDRAHRIGQKDNVLVKHYVVPGTIDARMIQTIVDKQEVIDKALDTDPGEWTSEPVFVPRHEPLGRRKEIAEEALLITREQTAQIHADLRTLAARCDGARELDRAGFNKIDSAIGKELAALPVLTPRQAALGARICRKYAKQLGK